MSYMECLKNLNEIQNDTEADDRYLRMRLAEVYGCILCSSLTTEQCNDLLDRMDRIGANCGFVLSRVSNIFYESEW